jgi:hypothetical protein
LLSIQDFSTINGSWKPSEDLGKLLKTEKL